MYIRNLVYRELSVKLKRFLNKKLAGATGIILVLVVLSQI